jgi:hypothetical protein
MENLSRNDISFRLGKIKGKVSEINKKIEKNNEEFGNRYNFAKNIGIKVENLSNTTDEVINGLNKYIEKVEQIISKYDNIEDSEDLNEEYKVLNNILYLDDIKLKNISELVNENKELTTREFINTFATKANDLIRNEEIKSIDSEIKKISKTNFIEKITGKYKIKKAMVENYNLKKIETMNKKYIPENKSLYEIVCITNNCGYKSKDIDNFIDCIVNEFKFEKPEAQALIKVEKENKIPFFYNKELLNKLNIENANMLDKINNKKKTKEKLSEYKMYNDMLINDVSTLELFNFNNEEVI